MKQVTGHGKNNAGQTTQKHSAHTRVAVRVPGAVGLAPRFEISNGVSSYLRPDADQFNTKVKLKDYGFGGMEWAMTASTLVDQAFMDGLLRGDFAAHVQALPGSFVIKYKYGSLVFVSGDGYASGETLDVMCRHVCGLAQAFRQAALAGATKREWDETLSPPVWMGEAAAPQGAQATQLYDMAFQRGGLGSQQAASDRIGGLGEPLMEPWRTHMAMFAQASGGALEEPLEFHRAFPGAPLPGRAYAVCGPSRAEAGRPLERGIVVVLLLLAAWAPRSVVQLS